MGDVGKGWVESQNRALHAFSVVLVVSATCRFCFALNKHFVLNFCFECFVLNKWWSEAAHISVDRKRQGDASHIGHPFHFIPAPSDGVIPPTFGVSLSP